jgi:CRP/FNR family transcriptional regulator, cyclic AMP receptor protein
MASLPTVQLLPERVDKRTLFREHPFFRGLDSHIIDQLAPRAVTRKVKKGTVLFRKGDIGSTLYAILAGVVRVSAPSTGGKEAVFSLVVPGEVFGEIALLDGGERTADAIAVADCELVVIERRDFTPMLRQYPDLAIRFIEIVCERVRRTSEQVEDILFLDLAPRLGKALLHLNRRTSEKASQGVIRITQREISQLVGASRESTNKQLRKWQRMKLVKVERGGVIVLAPGALARLISDS